MSRYSTFLTQSEQMDLYVICQQVRLELIEQACRFLHEHKSNCVLLGYVADATPLHTRWRLSQTLKPHAGESKSRRLMRLATRACDYLLQRIYCKAFLAAGVGLAIVPFPPIPLHHGKKSWNLFSAAEAATKPFLETAMSCELRVIHICCDRGALSGCARKFHQHICQQARVKLKDDREIESEMSLKTWFVSTGCSIHDCHNALKYGLSDYMHCGGAFSLELHSLTKQMRKLVTHLHSILPEFLRSVLCFRQPVGSEVEIRLFWQCMGIPQDWLDTFVLVNPTCAGDVIAVNASLEEAEGSFDTVVSVMCFCLRFRLHVESRWLSVGAAARCLLIAHVCGIPLLIQYAQTHSEDDLPMSQNFASALESEHVFKFTCLAAPASFPLEALESKLMQDSRLCSRWPEYIHSFQEWVSWLQELPAYVWSRIASLSAQELRRADLQSEVMNAIIVMRGYLFLRIDKTLAEYPWCLAVGDRKAQLELLVQRTEMPLDPTAAKIQVLLRSGSVLSVCFPVF